MTNSCKLSTIGVLLLAIVTLSSCSKKPADALIGKWTVQDQKSAVVEFRKDGTLTSDENGHVATGTYKFTDSSHMEMQIADGGDTNHAMTIPCEVNVHGDRAVVTILSPDVIGTKKTAVLVRLK